MKRCGDTISVYSVLKRNFVSVQEGKGTERTVEKMEEMAWISWFYRIWRSVSIFIICIFLFSDFFGRDKFMRFRIVQVPIQDSSDECFIWYIFHYFGCKSLDSFLSCYKSCYTLFFKRQKKVNLSVDILYSGKSATVSNMCTLFFVTFIFLIKVTSMVCKGTK